MTQEQLIYQMPNVGCMVGTAYQVLVARLAETLAEAGLELSVPEYMILRALYTRDGLQQCEIGTMLGKDKGAISRCVAAMARRNLVATEPVSHKCLRVYLTDESRRLKPTILAIARQRQQALETILTPDEINCFVNALKKIIETKI